MNPPCEHVGPAPKFAFAIPLMPRAAAADWEQVQLNLRRTVRSVLGAASGHAADVYIACHDEPELGELFHENVHVRSVPFPPQEDPSTAMCDRDNKRRFIGAWLRRDIADNVFVMFLDADDLVHRDIVSYALSHPARSYVVETGYLLDADRGLLLRRRDRYYLTCGSSFVCQFDTSELPSSWDDLDARFSLFGKYGHPDYPRIANEIGKPPEVFPFPAGVYVVNHGDNHWTTMSGRKRMPARRADIVRPAAARRILESDFNAADLARRIVGPWGVTRASAAVVTRTTRRWLATTRSRF